MGAPPRIVDDRGVSEPASPASSPSASSSAASAPREEAAAPVFDRLLLTGAAGGLGRELRPRLRRWRGSSA